MIPVIKKIIWVQKNNFPGRGGFEKKKRSLKDSSVLGIDGIVRCNHVGFNTGDSVFTTMSLHGVAAGSFY